MGHQQRFRVPTRRPSVEQTARDLGLSPAEFHRITKMVDAVLAEEKVVAVGRGAVGRSGLRRSVKKSRSRAKRPQATKRT